MTAFSNEELSEDGFLGGRIRVLQPRRGYRAATDPVFLAASVPLQSGESVLELGCGAGVAALCLKHRQPNIDVTGIELQPEYADLARRNARRNDLPLTVIDADLTNLPAELGQMAFDHVIANPPYLISGAGSPANDVTREIAFREATPLIQWIDVALKRLKPRGLFTLIHLTERLPDILAALGGRAGSIEIKPLASRQGRTAGRIILRARKSGKAALRLHAPLVLHEGARHDGDRESYTPEVKAILREGSALHFG